MAAGLMWEGMAGFGRRDTIMRRPGFAGGMMMMTVIAAGRPCLQGLCLSVEHGCGMAHMWEWILTSA